MKRGKMGDLASSGTPEPCNWLLWTVDREQSAWAEEVFSRRAKVVLDARVNLCVHLRASSGWISPANFGATHVP
jgi:hypothetical protein